MCNMGVTVDGKNIVPFKIECCRCGSHNVELCAIGYLDLEIVCKSCKFNINVGCYNEKGFE